MNEPLKRKYKIFISSSFLDMEHARLELLLKTLKLGHIPAGMELFKPGEQKNLDVIEQEIATSDVYVIFVGARAGSRVPGEDPLTYTMKEFQMARDHKLPIIPFLLNETEYRSERDKLLSDDVSEREQEQRLKDFRNRIQERDDGSKRIAGFFSYTNISKLCDDYGDSLRQEVDRLNEAGPHGGWVEGIAYDQWKGLITLSESVGSNPFFRRFAERLNTFNIFSYRAAKEAEAKTAIAQHFWKMFMPKLDELKTQYIYFESGSSIAYVSQQFIEYVKQSPWFHARELHRWLRLRTNNLLTYLEFLLVEPPWSPIEIQLMPHGFISTDYGATYGDLNTIRPQAPAARAMPDLKLNHDAALAINSLKRRLVGSNNTAFSEENGLALMTTSGIDTYPNSPFPGPHVGSYYNMLMKRCLFSLPCPKVLFLDERKWGYQFELGNCHSICDSQSNWKRLTVETPLAIAMSIKDRAKRESLVESFRQNGFEHQEWGNLKSHEGGLLPVIAANKKFAERFF